MRVMKFISVVAVLVIISSFVAAQAASQNAPVVKHVPITNAPSNSGKEMYNSYCAVCHGKDGKGNGPATEALKVPPTNLTLLSKNNGGKYPDMKVASAIRGDANLPAHGSKDMPVWGRLFWSMSHGHEAEVQQRVSNLNQYIEGMQAK